MALPLPINTALPSTPAVVSPGVSANAASLPAGAAAGANYTDINGLEALKSNSQSPEALGKVAQQVEAMFLQMMLKSMRDASPGDGIFDSDEGKMYQDMFDKQVALDMSKHQDVGIGALLMRQLTQKSSLEKSSRSKAAAAATAATTQLATGSHTPDTTPEAFIAGVLPGIRVAARKIGVSPEGMLAQAALESGWGRRVARTADGASSNNLFGIKAGSGWTGPKANAGTVEFDGTIARRHQASFRAYGSIQESIDDFAQMISTSPRFREALSAGTDVHAYVRAVAVSGYATDPEYANKLNEILQSDRLKSAFGVRTAALQK